MHSADRALAAVERALHLQLPRGLFLPGGLGPFDETVDPEALLEPAAGAVRGGELLPDALPFARGADGAVLALRFGPGGRPREAIAWHPGGAWHPTDLAPGLASEPARLRRACEAALESGLAVLAGESGAASLAQDLGVARETFSDWLLDARLVPAAARAALRRLTGAGDVALFAQDWSAAASAARAALAARPDLAWPGAVLGWHEEGRGRAADAARAYAGALGAFGGTLAFAGRLARPGESAARVISAAWQRATGGRAAPDPALRAALAGPGPLRAHLLAESDRARAEGRHAAAWDLALRAGWQRHVAVDMDDVLGRMLDAAEAAGHAAHAELARLHLRAWVGSGR
ncbi:SMI1/KNR4 family protein [Anaeromyxobacter dehalogenans]|uniref:Uncharacterized protein n=1 Tax=Anaeromyxobacter dehalogenans (strain 2CP-C) TaxID=290397 RepID=Q2IG13_ANADE|nr:SMI1/KNR4 family protein [Anaeromyxobacter dehalogenans]ABC83524.1 hypothetical protein Adeh_3758 [Anaeromyxobacter dehalogenans 2CP-C]